MGANDSPTTTRSVVNDYFEWRLNNKPINNNRLSFIVRKIASESENAYRNQDPIFNSNFFSSTPINLETLNNIKSIHNEIAKEMFNDGTTSWTRIITFISFSAMLAEHIIQLNTNQLPSNVIISTIVDWTSDFIDNDLESWLKAQNSWAGCLKFHDKTPQRRNSISRYAGILGTLGVLTLGALYMRRI